MLQGVGYGILVGFGAFFALICSGLAYFDVTFGGHKDSSEHFQTASRNIKTGLIAGAEPVFCSSIHCLKPSENGLHMHAEQSSDLTKVMRTAVDVVSHWTWSITLLQSSTVAWGYGVSGPFW